MPSRAHFPIICAVLMAGLLSGCSLFGRGPIEHTTVDYESLDPAGHGAAKPENYRYGHTDETHSGTGIDDQ